MAVASFALAKGGFGGALSGDVDACGDDEAYLTLSVAEGGGGPGDSAEGAIAVEPLIFEGGGEGSGAKTLEGSDGVGDLTAGDELVPGVATDECGELVSGGDLAGAVEADDAPSGVEDRNEGTDGVEDGRDEVAFDGESGFNALTRAGGTIHLANATVELEAGDDLAAEDAKRVGLLGSEATGCGVEDEKSTNAGAAGSCERSAGVEAIGAAFDVDAVGGEVWIAAGVLNFVDGVAEDGRFAGQATENQFGCVDAGAGLDPDAVRVDQRDGCDWGAAELRGESGDVVENGIRGSGEDLVLMEGFDSESFVFDQESVHLTS